jgi:hypothetical protein
VAQILEQESDAHAGKAPAGHGRRRRCRRRGRPPLRQRLGIIGFAVNGCSRARQRADCNSLSYDWQPAATIADVSCPLLSKDWIDDR